MGGQQSRVVQDDNTTNPSATSSVPVNEEDKGTEVSIKFSPELVEGLTSSSSSKSESSETKAAPVTTSPPPTKMKSSREQEDAESKKIQSYIDELNKGQFRAPVRTVQCSAEREKCLECYTTKEEGALACREVAEKFIACARVQTEAFVQQSKA